jgi:hypothetical protein
MVPIFVNKDVGYHYITDGDEWETYAFCYPCFHQGGIRGKNQGYQTW